MIIPVGEILWDVYTLWHILRFMSVFLDMVEEVHFYLITHIENFVLIDSRRKLNIQKIDE